ncbi:MULTISPECIES: SUMF1/EgtB/PvdO family nonheme iron enzyme [unclassified Colwellia]|uniref:SUMF1/EgtB/PvdO family nonheme iron enzyme n=1 Tax=unclassified Colwellia TaxID=196834 RepID=UPI0015F6FDBC|nr:MULTISPECIES: formylglycine-generating enzyme family protein [unclassified Colwellia]MBA6232258.1 SUMF1/EgtB/PvdO family nonheme iron enzyme [Colwellia sp. MB02u-7]MBA6237750.1 SUMF1/EgtB/PvdO family nonheme iron enzyme [Colwellia sp. MB02u-11]MBA6257787.1 SUMF1/EgtB/PvdO family nonheme iron enzyme [Colwellia sp. MB3u-28]MBA6260844.1 SUMF1/EgtB/PvdO family nonheme iron enzyme [Colwellia sp. MB3u-41]MBA6300888.1 SUMF1/EgtB/PvdO family nonheme iron enzyme [Colwellia sp. MB3u-22]
MRLALLALTISCLSLSSFTHAFETTSSKSTTVESLEIELSNKETQYSAFITALEDLNAQVTAEEDRLTRLRAQGKVLQTLRQEALLNMNEQYESMVDNPEQDIAQSQNDYRQSIINQTQNKNAIKASVTNLSDAKTELAKANIDRFTLANNREALIEEIRIARVKRLRREFEKQDELEVYQVVTCDTQETLNKCITRGNRLAKQKASKTFLDKLFNVATESSLINQYKKDSAAQVRLVKHKVKAGEFSGQGNYGTTIIVEMQGSLPNNEACVLLNISARYCGYQEGQPSIPVVDETANSQQAAGLSDDTLMYELTVRSDQYDDEVFIDGVSYGSTKLSVMLSAGHHDVNVTKPGYSDYQQQIRLSKNTLIKVELLKAAINLANGEKIQDILPGNELGPELIGVPAGRFQMGDMKGAGLSNEKPARGEQILKAFAIGQNQITVGDFKRFVKETNYVTEAESTNGCAAFIDGEPKYNNVLNWRNPGFSQADDHPVVCVSDIDSKAYLTWLSKQTEREYRLPNEMEWEYVARAGSVENYWWGNDIGNGKANCAYCGSKWSNRSTAPVKSFRANKLGLYDTVGNVWELTNGDKVVARGGAWNFAPKLARTSVRLELSSGFRSNYLGFRALREN